MPLLRYDGSVFGTLCGLDSRPGSALARHIDLLELLAGVLASQLEEEETSQERERFLAVLGHDLRNPLNAIMMTTRVLVATGGVAPEERLQVILRSGRRIEEMISDVLDFARGRFGDGIVLEPAPVVVSKLVASLVDEFSAAKPGRQIRFESELENETACWDEMRVAQVLSNLIGNALEHGPDDSQVTVTASRREDGFYLAVNNLGEEIPRSVIPRLFRPFSRASKEAVGSRSGLGLGLYIVAQIVAAHGGDIQVHSDSESGTTFTVALPVDTRI